MTAPYMGTFSIPYNTRDILGSYSSAQKAAKSRDRALALTGMMTDMGNPLDKLLAYRKERQISPGFQESQIQKLAGDNYAEKQFQSELLSRLPKKKEPLPLQSGPDYSVSPDLVRDMSGGMEYRTSNRLQPGGQLRDVINRPTFTNLPRGLETQGTQTGGYDIPSDEEVGIGGILSGLVSAVARNFGNEGGGGAVVESPYQYARPIQPESMRFVSPYDAVEETSLIQPLDIIQPNAALGDIRGRVGGGESQSALASGSLQEVEQAVSRRRGGGRPLGSKNKPRGLDPTQTTLTQLVSEERPQPMEGEAPQPPVRSRGKQSAPKSRAAKASEAIRTMILDEDQFQTMYSIALAHSEGGAEAYGGGGAEAYGGGESRDIRGSIDPVEIYNIPESVMSREEKVQRMIELFDYPIEFVMDKELLSDFGNFLYRYPSKYPKRGESAWNAFIKEQKQTTVSASRLPGGGNAGGGFGGLH
jgi:hypothetical protein